MVTVAASCALCELDLGISQVTLTVDGDVRRFCCRGCASVYEIARSSGLLEDVLGRPAARRDRLRDIASRRGTTAYISMKGMWCAGCAIAAERILRRQPGILLADISFASERGRLQYDPEQTGLRDALKSLDGLGYSVRVIGDSEGERTTRRQENMLLQLITAVAFGMQVMNLSIVHLYPAYALGQFDAPAIRTVQYLAWLLATPALFYGGSSFLRGAWRALHSRTATMDMLVALGTLSAYLYSVYFTLNGGGAVYFDSVTMITAFVVIGRYLETLGGDQARKDIRTLLHLQPDTAWLQDGGTWREVAAGTLAPGDTILVRPGQRVPADANVLEGKAAVDEALLTGEPVPVQKRPADEVFAGTLATDGALICSVLRATVHTRLAAITRTVETTLAAKPPIQRIVDTVSAWFAGGMVAAAALSFLAWWIIEHSLSQGLLAAVAVLVVACPCALGLATPFALSIALGRTARSGVLVRNLAALETAAIIRRIAFDKTGTLTRGQMSVAAVTVNPHGSLSSDELLALAAAVEQHSEHPLAKAIVAACPPGQHMVAKDFKASSGEGVSARLTDTTNRRISVGSLDYAGVNGCGPLEMEAGALADRGQSIVWIGADATVAGFIALRDEPNPTARDALEQFKAAGVNPVVLSGDNARTTRAIAMELALVDAEGACTPIDKAERIRAWQAAGERVAMVGDGVNDAPALAQADLSIAMGTGSDVAGQTSDVVLMRPDLTLLVWFIGLSRRTRAIIRENLVWAFAYNAFMVPLAAAGAINPMLAAAAMATSSLLVVGNSLRL